MADARDATAWLPLPSVSCPARRHRTRNGAAKTTALHILTTLSLPDRGWARVAGHDVVKEAATIHAWPMQHPVEASLLWSVALLLILAPLATFLYRRRTTG